MCLVHLPSVGFWRSTPSVLAIDSVAWLGFIKGGVGFLGGVHQVLHESPLRCGQCVRRPDSPLRQMAAVQLHGLGFPTRSHSFPGAQNKSNNFLALSWVQKKARDTLGKKVAIS